MSEPHLSATIAGIKVIHLIAGFVGAVCALSFMPSMGVWARLSAVGVGMAAAVFIGPGAAELLAASDRVAALIIFVVGLLAMALIPAMHATAARVPGEVWDIIRDRIGGKGK